MALRTWPVHQSSLECTKSQGLTVLSCPAGDRMTRAGWNWIKRKKKVVLVRLRVSMAWSSLARRKQPSSFPFRLCRCGHQSSKCSGEHPVW
jgi:hypothetical protein